MLKSNYKAESHFVLCGIGAPLLAFIEGLIGKRADLKTAFICPLWAPLLVPLCMLFPFLGAIIFSKAKKGHEGYELLGFRFGLILEIFYFLLLYFIYQYLSYKSGILWDIYAKKASLNHHNLQIATPEQLEYSQSLLFAYAQGAFAYILGFVFIQSAVFAKILGRVNPIKVALKAVFINLPSYILLICISIAVFSIVEKYFANLKLHYLESYILGKEAFKPDYWFIALRLYLYQGMQTGYLIVSAISLGLIKKKQS